MADPTITFDPVASFDSVRTFDVTGTTQGIAPGSQLYFYATASSDPSTSGDIGTTLVKSDGTFDFKDGIPSVQNFLTASYYDPNSKEKYYAKPPYALNNAFHIEDVFSPSSGDLQYEIAFVRGGRTTVIVTNDGESIPTYASATFQNHASPNNTFVFDPGYGHDVVQQFRIGGDDHDTLSLKGADFGETPEAQLGNLLLNTHNARGGLVIVDPTTHDTVRLAGIAKGQLIQNERDIVFHA